MFIPKRLESDLTQCQSHAQDHTQSNTVTKETGSPKAQLPPPVSNRLDVSKVLYSKSLRDRRYWIMQHSIS